MFLKFLLPQLKLRSYLSFGVKDWNSKSAHIQPFRIGIFLRILRVYIVVSVLCHYGGISEVTNSVKRKDLFGS